MTTTINVIDRTRTIELTQKFAKAAQRFGSEEYKMLQEVKKDNPNYKVVVKKAASGNHMKGLTHEYMEKYLKDNNFVMTIETEDTDEDGNPITRKDDITALEVFYSLCGKDENGKALEFAEAVSYGELKQWFLEQFPELKPSNNVKKMLSAKKKEEKAA